MLFKTCAISLLLCNSKAKILKTVVAFFKLIAVNREKPFTLKKNKIIQSIIKTQLMHYTGQMIALCVKHTHLSYSLKFLK